MLLIDIIAAGREQAGRSALIAAKALGIWLVVLMAAYVLFWPGLWVAPGHMLSEVYGNAFTYTFQGARLSVVGQVDPGNFGLDTLTAGLRSYLSDLTWRTTGLTWLGFLLGIVLAVADFRQKRNRNFTQVVLYGVILAAAFVLMFSVQRGPKPPHYTLTSYICMDLIAGLGYARALQLLAQRFLSLARGSIIWGV